MKKLVLLTLIFYTYFSVYANFPTPGEIDITEYTADHPDWYGYITAIADGDTFYIDFYSEKKMGCRIKGIDTPETKDKRKPVQFWGPEASAYSKKMLGSNRFVRLDFEGEITGPFGRLLVTPWIYIEETWKNYAQMLLETGNAFFYPKYPMPLQMAHEYLEYQQKAIKNKAGMWAFPEKIENKICTSKEQLYNEYSWYRRAVKNN